jgi:hypothetical protein
MARIFTISFSYEGTERSAVINVRNTAYSTEYVVTLMDQELAKELHSDTIVSGSGNRLRYLDSLAESTLMSSVLAAVNDHIKISNPVSRA